MTPSELAALPERRDPTPTWHETPILGFNPGLLYPLAFLESSHGYRLGDDIVLSVAHPTHPEILTISVWRWSISRTVVLTDQHLLEAGYPASAAPVVAETPTSPYQEAIEWIGEHTELKQERLASLFNVSRQTIHNWKHDENITDANRQRLLAVREILERAWERHPSPKELTAWLDTPRGTDGRTPAQLLERGELARARLLALSRRSEQLQPRRLPERPLPPSIQYWAEERHQLLPPNEDHELFIEYGTPGGEDDGEEEADDS